MTTDIELQPAEIDETAAAFDTMSRKLAGLTAAVEGFASRQQEMHARDYGSDLARLLDATEKMRIAINTLDRRPAMALTPERIASQIEVAGEQTRSADHQVWDTAHRGLNQAIQTLGEMTVSARKAENQNFWLAIAAAIALVIGLALGMVLPERIDQTMPESWHWPEQRAASVLGRSEWDAGLRLLEVADLKRAKAMEAAVLMPTDNIMNNASRSVLHTKGVPRGAPPARRKRRIR
jgi:hypothetical protein